jgi:hypothetical protein
MAKRGNSTYRSDNSVYFEIIHPGGTAPPSSLRRGHVCQNLVAEHRHEKKLILRHHIVIAAIIIHGRSATVLLVHLEPEFGDGSSGVDGDNEVVIDERGVLASCYRGEVGVLVDCVRGQSGPGHAFAVLSTAIPIAP